MAPITTTFRLVAIIVFDIPCSLGARYSEVIKPNAGQTTLEIYIAQGTGLQTIPDAITTAESAAIVQVIDMNLMLFWCCPVR